MEQNLPLFFAVCDTIKPSIEMKIFFLLSFSLPEYDEGSRMPFIDMNLTGGMKVHFDEYFR